MSVTALTLSSVTHRSVLSRWCFGISGVDWQSDRGCRRCAPGRNSGFLSGQEVGSVTSSSTTTTFKISSSVWCLTDRRTGSGWPRLRRCGRWCPRRRWGNAGCCGSRSLGSRRRAPTPAPEKRTKHEIQTAVGSEAMWLMVQACTDLHQLLLLGHIVPQQFVRQRCSSTHRRPERETSSEQFRQHR